jgi:dipeptidyl aminopeptidase/acylaminoacyl peptidase
MSFSSRGVDLIGHFFAPRGNGTAPLLVYNHGSERDPDLRWLGAVGRYYQARGVAVFFPWRRGCSGSGGRYWEERFPQDGADAEAREARTIRALEDESLDVLEAIRFARSLPGVDRDAVFVGGSSFGGLIALLVASSSSEIKGAIACSAGAWAYDGNTETGQQRLFEIVKSAKAPIFLMQAENDYNPRGTARLGEAMVASRFPGFARTYPPFGSSAKVGHAGFCNKGSDLWGDDVLGFLEWRTNEGR